MNKLLIIASRSEMPVGRNEIVSESQIVNFPYPLHRCLESQEFNNLFHATDYKQRRTLNYVHKPFCKQCIYASHVCMRDACHVTSWRWELIATAVKQGRHILPTPSNELVWIQLCFRDWDIHAANRASGVRYEFNSSTTAELPARLTGVLRDSSSKSGQAPFSRSSFTTLSSPFPAVRDNGV
jgi:hypothetical protein